MPQESRRTDGAVTSVEFHPNELLLATGSADRAVKLWDLETFELVDECVEATGIKSLRFSPDGSALLAGTAEFLKTWRWEPAQCHDAVDVSWKNLKDLSVHDNKLLGANISNSFVGVWVVDLTRVEPFHSGAERGPGGGGTRDAEREERSRRGPEETAAAAVAAAAEASRARLEREERQRRVLMEANGGERTRVLKPSARDRIRRIRRSIRVASRATKASAKTRRTPMAMNPRFRRRARRARPDRGRIDRGSTRSSRERPSVIVIRGRAGETTVDASKRGGTPRGDGSRVAGTRPEPTRRAAEPNAYRDEDEENPEDLPDENAARATNGQKADTSDGEDDSRLETRLGVPAERERVTARRERRRR